METSKLTGRLKPGRDNSMILLKRFSQYLKTKDWDTIFGRCEKVGKAVIALAKAITFLRRLL